MIVECEKCHRRFDDEFRWKICPHDTFAANDGQNNFAHHRDSYLEPPIATKERLARVLQAAGAPAQMVGRAAAGHYDDYESPSATPIANLVRDLRLVGLYELAKRAMDGEFDGTREESRAWFERGGS